MIVGIKGLAGSGKGTVADILSEYGFRKISFADAVKDSCSVIFGWDRSLLEGDTDKSREFRETVDDFWSDRLACPEFTPRKAMQLMGTEAGRHVFGPGLWVANTEIRIKQSLKDQIPVVIPDVRFPEEIDLIKQMNGKMIQIERGDRPDYWDPACSMNMHRSDKMLTDATRNAIIETFRVHPSEFEWIGYGDNDAEIKNNGSPDDLKFAVQYVMSRF